MVLRSQLCSAESLRSPALRTWADRLRPMWAGSDDGGEGGEGGRDVMLHRKMWEWLFVAEALHERGMLAPGRSGLGFGVGQEPLTALFAAEGCDVVATDQPRQAAVASGWTDSSSEWAGGLENLNQWGLCDPDEFARRVRFEAVDMNALPGDLRTGGGFDFTWSSCALEHLGTLAAGADFVVEQMDCLKPGGVAVHTTEYLVSSNDVTVEAGGTVFYRRRDIEALVARLRKQGHDIDVDYTEGTTPEDLHVDVPPYSDVHLRTELAGYVTTSLALVVTKGAGRRAGGRLRAMVGRRGGG
jgi:SAM-dependent methyltransferase